MRLDSRLLSVVTGWAIKLPEKKGGKFRDWIEDALRLSKSRPRPTFRFVRWFARRRIGSSTPNVKTAGLQRLLAIVSGAPDVVNLPNPVDGRDSFGEGAMVVVRAEHATVGPRR
jgi:hypothetical protein